MSHFQKDEERALRLVNSLLTDRVYAWITHAIDYREEAKKTWLTAIERARYHGMATVYAITAVDALRAMIGVDAAGRIIERLRLDRI